MKKRKTSLWHIIAEVSSLVDWKLVYNLPDGIKEAAVELRGMISVYNPEGATVALYVDGEVVGQVQYARNEMILPVEVEVVHSHVEPRTDVRENHTAIVVVRGAAVHEMKLTVKIPSSSAHLL